MKMSNGRHCSARAAKAESAQARKTKINATETYDYLAVMPLLKNTEFLSISFFVPWTALVYSFRLHQKIEAVCATSVPPSLQAQFWSKFEQ